MALLTWLALAVAIGPGAGQAAAHDVLISSDPADGASLPAAPPRVALLFNLPVQAGFNTVTVVGPDGTAWQDGDPQVNGPTVAVALRPLGPAGRYEVRYRVVSQDGHPITGVVGFSLTTPGTGVAPPGAPQVPPAAQSEEPSSRPIWPWIAGAAVLAVIAAGVARRVRR